MGGVRYGAALLPSDDVMAELYERAVERLEKIGIERYEISNFARPGYESRHNLKYWQMEPYAGFGVDAHSFDGARRFSNAGTVEKYLQERASGEPPQQSAAETDLEEEHFFVGLRLARGIEPSRHEWSRFREPIARVLDAGLVVKDGTRLRLTKQGYLVSNEVFQEFVNA